MDGWFSGICFSRSFFAIQIVNTPKDLGTQVEYIGQKNFGCAWWQGVLTLGFCGDRDVNHSYFYATDLDEEQLKTYFKNANIELVPQYDSTPPYPQVSTELRFHVGQEYATAMYYPNAQGFLTQGGLNFRTKKMHVLDVGEPSYKIIRNTY